jgi:hypothetical protein
MRRWIGIVSAVWLVAGCQASTGGGSAKVKVDLAPNVQDYQVQQVAVLAFANTAGNPDADVMYNYILQAMGANTKYVISTVEMFESEVKRAGVQEDYDRVVDSWRKRRLIDEIPLGKVLDATGNDGLLCMAVTKWERLKLEPTQEGTSNTTVGLSVELYAPDATLLWAANHTKIAKSPPYNPEFNVRSTMSGESRTTSASSVPDPPLIEKVAMEAANEAVATMPNLTSASAPAAGDKTP